MNGWGRPECSHHIPTRRIVLRSIAERLRLAAVFIALSLFAVAPALHAESCGSGNQCPVVDSLSANPGIFSSGQTGQILATAHDPDRSLTRYDFSADAGSFPNGTTTQSVPTSATSASLNWTAPGTTGTFNLTVRVWDNGGFMGVPASGTVSVMTIPVTISASNHAPVITSFTTSRTALFVGETAILAATATDADGDPIAWSWSATFGTVTPDASGGALFQAPATAGMATVTVTATDSQGAATQASLQLSIGSLLADKAIGDGLLAPQRMGIDTFGTLFVADGAAGGLVAVNAGSGVRELTIPINGITSVAVDWLNRLLVGESAGATLRSREGIFLAPLDPGEPLGDVTDVATDLAAQRFAVLYGSAGRVVVFGSNGAVLSTFGGVGDAPGQFKTASCLAISPSSEILVGDIGHGLIQVFDVWGNRLRSFGGRGAAPGSFNQLQGLAVDADGAVYASDAFQSRVQVFNSGGTLREIVGVYGSGIGTLKTPSGILALSGSHQIAVASVNASSIQIYDQQNAILPPSNTSPGVPQPVSPVADSLLPHNSIVLLIANNSTDPDFQSIRYAFELDFANAGIQTAVGSWFLDEGADGTTFADATAITTSTGPGSYVWRVRAWDGVAWSDWSADQLFRIDSGRPNRPPGTPVLESPISGGIVPTVSPRLTVLDTSDPDGDALEYSFQAALFVDGAYQTIASSPLVPAAAGSTSWDLPAGAATPSQRVFWRNRAFDGFAWGSWSGWDSFRTPPLTIPDPGAYGNLPTGDRTRSGEVRYSMGPRNADTLLFFRLFDVTASGELTLWVNGSAFAALPAGATSSWSLTLSVVIPASELSPSANNVLSFVHSGGGDWGIRAISLTAPSIPVIRATPYNTVVDVSWRVDANIPSRTNLLLYRSFYPSGPFSSLGNHDPAAGVLRDTGLDNEVPVYYRGAYVAFDGTEGEPSATVTATPIGSGGPTPITDLRVTRAGNDLRLDWTPVTSMPSLQQCEIYSGFFGAWSADTTGLSNLLGYSSPFDAQKILANEITVNGDRWYSILPRDYNGARGEP